MEVMVQQGKRESAKTNQFMWMLKNVSANKKKQYGIWATEDTGGDSVQEHAVCPGC
jgi:hypothetical protein